MSKDNHGMRCSQCGQEYRKEVVEPKWPEKKLTYEYIEVYDATVVDKRYNAGFNDALKDCIKAWQDAQKG